MSSGDVYSATVEWTCSYCGALFEPMAWQVRKYEYRCRACTSAHNAAYRQRRKAEGRPIRSSSWKPTLEGRRLKDKRYTARPEVKAKLAERARARSRNPVEQAKMASRRLLRSAIEQGIVIRQPCEVCGMTPTDGHHDDYLRPLDVHWLCRIHHSARHRAAATGEDV